MVVEASGTNGAYEEASMDALRIAWTWNRMKGWLTRAGVMPPSPEDGHHEGLFAVQPWEPLDAPEQVPGETSEPSPS